MEEYDILDSCSDDSDFDDSGSGTSWRRRFCQFRFKLQLYWLPALFHGTFIFYLSSLPGGDDHGIGRFDFLPFHDLFLFDKVSHMGLYFILGAALLLGFSHSWCVRDRRLLQLIRTVAAFRFIPRPPRISINEGALYALVVGTGLLFAVSDEIHQFFVPGRYVSVQDLVADLIGLTGACFVHILWRQRKVKSARL